VQLQRVFNQDLEYREQIINDHMLRSHEKEADAWKDIEALKKEERLIKENEKAIEVLKKEQDHLIVEKS